MGSVIGYQEAHGPVATFETDVAGKIKKIETSIEPIQDLHGYDSPWPAGGGKNLFDQNNTKYLAKDARSYGASDDRALAQINTLPAGTYTLSFAEKVVSLNEMEPVGTRFGLYLRATSGEQTFNVNAQTNLITPTVGQIITKSVTFTLTDEYVGKFQYFYVYTGKNVSGPIPNEYTANIYDVQIELGSTATAYAPYSNICPITGWTGAKVMKCRKNLLDDKKYQYTATQVRIGTDGSSDYNYIPRGIYTLSVTANVDTTVYYRIEGADAIRIGMNGGTFELEQDVLVCFYCYRSGSLSVDDITQWQLELGSTATAYEPYVGSTYDITFPSAAGTVYGGTLDVVKGELVVDRRYKNLNDPSKWISSTGTQDFVYVDDINDRMIYSSSFEGLVCSAFPIRLVSDGAYMRWTAVASKRVGIKNVTTAYTLTDIQQMAQNGKIAIVYTLATPITYQLTPQEINTIIGTNTIYADTGDTSVIYPKTITPIETVSNMSLLELRRNIIMAMQHNYIPDITTYGVEWNYSNPSTVLTRTGNAANFSNPIPAESLSETGSSPFDNIYPWSEMKRYNIINGEVAYSQDDAGYSETNYDTVVYIPEFYYKAEKDTTNQKWNWNISGRPIEGYEKHPGSGRYVGRFHTSGSSSGVFSKGGVTPLASTTRADFRTYSHNKGSNWWQIDIKTWSAIQLLYLIEFANWNSKDRLNRGQNTGAVVNTGATTNAAYHTLKRTGASGNMYRWIENPYSNLWIWLDGYIASNRVSYIFLTNSANYSDYTNNAETVGINIPSTNFITGFGYSNKCAWAFIPNNGSSSAKYTTYVTDKCYSTTGDNNLITGGYYMNYNDYGFFYFNATYPKSNANAKIGSRLIYIPTT